MKLDFTKRLEQTQCSAALAVTGTWRGTEGNQVGGQMGFQQKEKQEIVSFSDYKNETIDETTFCDIGLPNLTRRKSLPTRTPPCPCYCKSC